MGWIFYLIAVIFFFLSGVGSIILPNPLSWGLLCVALGLLVDRMPWQFGRAPPPAA